MSRGQLQLSAAACIWMAFLFLVLPLQWLLAAIAAAIFHELCHLCAIYLCGGRVSRVVIQSQSARIEIPPMPVGKELICALAGPVGGFLLLMAGRWFPRIAICAGMQSFYNLLPLYPLDGGRALFCLSRLLISPRWAEKICTCVECVTIVCIFTLAGYGVLAWGLGLFPVVIAAVLCLRGRYRKTPCKQPRYAVQ